MKKIVLLTLLLSAATAQAQQVQAGKAWTLQECIDYAFEHNLTLQQGALQVEQREIELGTARSSRLPAVSAGASQNFSFGRGLTADNTYANTNTTNSSFSIGADMPLFNGLRIKNNIALSKLNLQAATQELEKARDDVSVAVAQAYVQILYNKEIYEVAMRQVEIDSLQLVRIEERMRNGKATSAEVSAQKSSLAHSRHTGVQAANNLKLARLDLAQLLELPSPEGFDVVAPASGIQHRLLPSSPEAVYEEAVGIKASVRTEETRLAYAERSIALAKGGYLPSLSLNGGLGTNYYTSSGSPSQKFFDQLGNNFSQYVGLSLNIPVFSRFSTRNQVRSARLNYNNQQLQLDQAKKKLFKEIQQAWYNAATAFEKYESSMQAEEAATENFALVQARYENGKATITEFNEAKNQYLKAGSDRAQAQYEALYQAGLLDFYRGKNIEL